MNKVLFVLNDSSVDPLGPMFLAGNCGAECSAVFVNGKNEYALTQIPLDGYDVFAFSTITGSHQYHNALAGYIKKRCHSATTIMGGPHPTFFPYEAISLPNIDYICVGEGISAFRKFVRGERSPNIMSKPSFEKEFKLEPLVEMTKINPPRRDWIYKDPKRAANPIKNFMGAFGCPYKCSYCYASQMAKLYPNEKSVRYFPPQAVVDDMLATKELYPLKLLYIQDDTFIVNKPWFYNLTDRIKAQVNLPYHCHVRCDLLTREIVAQLKETGCRSVTYAVESASDVYRRFYLNRSMTNEKILECAEMLREAGIGSRIENMVGLPDDNFTDAARTLKLNMQSKPTVAWASLYQPFPNTPLAHLAMQMGEWSGDIDSICNSFFDKSPLKISFKYAIENLQKLFSFGGKGVWHYRAAILLSWLPLGWLYKKIYAKVKKKGYDELYGV